MTRNYEPLIVEQARRLHKRNPTWWLQYAGGSYGCLGCGVLDQWNKKFKHQPNCSAGWLADLLARDAKQTREANTVVNEEEI